MRHLLLVLPFVLGAGSAVAQTLDAAALFERAAPSVVKIVVSGTSETGQPRTEEGSGVILASLNRYTFVATAAHVIGKDDEWLPQDGRPLRDIQIQIMDSDTNRLDTPVAALVFEQSDAQDWVILLLTGGKDQPLPRGSEAGIKNGESVVLVGFKLSGSSAFPAPGSVAASLDPNLGYVLRLTGVEVLDGMSGGPILNSKGEVVGLASSDLREENGYHGAVPISLVGSVLDRIASGEMGNPLEQAVAPVTATAVVIVDASGSGGMPSSRGEGGVGRPVFVEASGSEASECDPGSGRTISHGRVNAKVDLIGSDTLEINVRVLAQGGHYRTASACIRDPFSGDRRLVGISGNDTLTNVSYQVRGTIMAPVDPILSEKVTLRWSAMPANSSINVVDAAGNLVVENLAVAGSGAVDVPVAERGTIVTNVNLGGSYIHQGSCCAVEDRVAASISIERWEPEAGE
jgi:S1-C subfamily serine protease